MIAQVVSMWSLQRSANNQLDFIDVLSIASFCIGLMNLDENVTQGDLADKSERILDEVHRHLQEQDEKLDWIMERLKS